MKKVAIISDIHANWEAMSNVLEDIKSHNVDAIYCLGDVIGYGPSPTECLTKAFECCEFIIQGNHEEGVLKGAFGIRQIAKDAMDWTRDQLKPGFFSSRKKKKLWEKLKNMPLTHYEGSYLFVHGSPRFPTTEYILPNDTHDFYEEIPAKIREIFANFDQMCFVGHTHHPGIITEASKWYKPDDFDSVWEIKEGERLICNVGSVGQPRDKDNRACYITLTDKEIAYHRVEYDFTITQEKINNIPQLDDKLAYRLEKGH